MLSEILLCTIKGKLVFHKSHVFLIDHFFKKEFCKQFNIHLLFRSQRPKTTSTCNKDPNTITDQKFYLPRGFTNGQGSLPVAITVRIGLAGCLLMSKPDSCEVISKSVQWFLRTRFFCTIQT